MFQINGAYNSAIVFTDNCDETTISQIYQLLNQPFVQGSAIRIMPDCHAGAGCVIGTTMTLHGKVVPNLVGVDIGCGMSATKISALGEIYLDDLDNVVREFIPSGFSVRGKAHEYSRYIKLNDLYCKDHINLGRAELSIGTLGGGNHFIELDASEDGTYLVVHTGSRNLGKQVAEYYQKLAIEYHKDRYRSAKETVLENARNSKNFETLEHYLSQIEKAPVNDLCYLEGDLFDQYINDMQICQKYACWNRWAITDVILEMMGWNNVEQFTTIHNYIDTNEMVLRKGAVSAKAGEKLIIPMNMRDGSLIAVGKGNAEWNDSAPHGAGRIMARGEAKRRLSVDDFQASMEGIFTTCVSASTLDESPMVYKPMDEIIENTADTIEILEVIKPVYNFKATE